MIGPRVHTITPFQGIAWMVGAVFCYTGLTLSIRYMSTGYSTVELVFYRSALAALMTFPIAARSGLSVLLTRRLDLHLVRAGTSYGGLLMWFYAVANLPLAEASALQFSEPLFTILLASLVLGEAVGKRRWIVTVIGFAGTLVILRPGLIVPSPAALAVLGSAAMFAGTYVSIRVLVRTEPTDVVVFLGYLLTMIIAAVPVFFDATLPRLADLPGIVVLALFSALGNMCLTRSFRAPVAVVMPFSFLRLPALALAGFVLFAEIPDIWTWIGALVIFGASYAIVRQERKDGAG